jgi:hypothetical protein
MGRIQAQEKLLSCTMREGKSAVVNLELLCRDREIRFESAQADGRLMKRCLEVVRQSPTSTLIDCDILGLYM